MSDSWRRLSREAGLRVVEVGVEVVFRDQRRQLLYVEEPSSDALRIWSLVARPSALNRLRTPRIDAWRRNRLAELVGFTLDRHDRMIGEAWVPRAGLTKDEWALYVELVAEACDRFEYLITGRDEE
jgi:hypothetical protein